MVWTDTYSRKIKEQDGFGVTVNYEYFSDGSLKKQTIGNDNVETITLYDAQQDNKGEYVHTEYDGITSNKYNYSYLGIDKTDKYDYNIITQTDNNNPYISEEYDYDVYGEKLVGIRAKEGTVTKAENTITYGGNYYTGFCSFWRHYIIKYVF